MVAKPVIIYFFGVFLNGPHTSSYHVYPLHRNYPYPQYPTQLIDMRSLCTEGSTSVFCESWGAHCDSCDCTRQDCFSCKRCKELEIVEPEILPPMPTEPDSQSPELPEECRQTHTLCNWGPSCQIVADSVFPMCNFDCYKSCKPTSSRTGPLCLSTSGFITPCNTLITHIRNGPFLWKK